MVSKSPPTAITSSSAQSDTVVLALLRESLTKGTKAAEAPGKIAAIFACVDIDPEDMLLSEGGRLWESSRNGGLVFGDAACALLEAAATSALSEGN